MQLAEVSLKFNYFKQFSVFLLEHIEDVSDEYVRLANELNPAWSKLFESNAAFKEFSKKRLIGFYESVIEDRAMEFSMDIVKGWKENQIPELNKYTLSSSDIIKSYSLRRMTNISFLDKYTSDIPTIKQIYLELEKFYAEITEYTINIYIDVYQEDLQVLNEELKASEEELQTTNEELIESQEELIALNEELREQIELRKQLEGLRENEKKYLENVLDNISDGIVACNEKGLLSFFNNATRAFHGLPEKEIPAEEWGEYYNLYHPDEMRPLKKEEIPLYRAFQGENINNVELVIAPNNGKKRWLLCNGNPIHSSDRIVGAVVVMHDITERKEVEEKLLLNNKRLELTNDALKDKQNELHLINIELVENQEELQTLNEELREQIEQRIQIENALRDSQLKYKMLVDNLEEAQAISHVGSWEFDLNTKKVVWSSEMYRIFGYSPDEMEIDYNNYIQHIHPDHRSVQINTVQRCIETHQSYTIEHKIISKDGQTKWIIGKGKIELSPLGEAIKMSGIAMDITDRKTTEIQLVEKNQELTQLLEELKSAEEQLLSANNELESRVKDRTEELEIVNNIGKLISAELDLNKIVQQVTDVTTQLTGAEFGAFFYNVKNENDEILTLYTISGVEREKFSQFPMPRNTKVFSPTFHGEGIVRVDDITNDPRYGKNPPYNGMPKGHLEVRSYLAVPVISRSGEVIGGLFYGHSKAGVFQEKTESLIEGIAGQAAIAVDNARLFESAQTNEKRLATLLESMPAIAWTATAEGGMDFFNNQFYQYTGKNYDNSKEWNWTEAIHADDLENTLTKWRESLSTGEDLEVEFRIKDYSEKYRWQLCRAIPLKDEKGKIFKWFGTCTEIDEQKETNNKLIQTNQDLLKVNEFLDTFVYIAAHDLRSPLSNLRMILDLLNKAIDPHKKQEFINALNLSVNKLDQTVNGLVKIIEIQSTDTSMVAKVDLHEIFTNVLEEYSREIEEKMIKIIEDFSQASYIVYIEAYLTSIIKNIIGNAIKYSSPNRTPFISIKTRRENNYLLLNISDNGVGMDLIKYGKNIFKPFTRFSKMADGKGLGLYLVKNMVEKNGGKIEVESEIDKGTTFKVCLKEY